MPETPVPPMADSPAPEPAIAPVIEAVAEAAPAAEAAATAAAEVAPEPAGSPAVVPSPRDLSPADCALQLKQRFPALFTGQPKPLKLRIQVDIQERAPGVFSKQALSAYFRRYTGSTAYLIAVSRAKQRFGLDGQPNGDLAEEHRQMALDELARRRANNESRAALEEQQRRNRATLLHDFQVTTLTPANFCALKGIAVEELDGYLATARREAEERAQHAPAFDARRPPGRPRPTPGRR